MKYSYGLGERLSCIAHLVTSAHKLMPYTGIWDCCCDHGYLGIALLEHFSTYTDAVPQVYFVDQVEHITKPLSNKLCTKGYVNYDVLTKDAGEISLLQDQNHCIVIAGITANGIIKLLKKLLKKHSNYTLDFILCPTRGIYDLRHYLSNNHMSLIDEHHVKENDRHYEVLHVKYYGAKKPLGRQISDIGGFWEQGNESHIDYLAQRIQYHQNNASFNDRPQIKKVLKRYKEIKDTLSIQTTQK